MSDVALAILATATLISIGMWLSVRASGLAEIELLPARCRRRVHWWHDNARYAQLVCALAAAVALGIQITVSVA